MNKYLKYWEKIYNSDIVGKIKKSANNYELAKLFCESDLFCNLEAPPCDEVYSYKSDQQAETFHLEGNKLFKKEKWIEAVKAYTLSLCYAVDEAKAALSFSSRSAALNKLNYKGYLEDIERAIKYGYPTNLRFELEERRAHFLSKINKKEHAQKSYEEAIKYLKKSDLSTKRINSLLREYKLQSAQCSSIAPVDTALESVLDYEKELQKLKERHAVFTSLSKECEVVYSEEKGRHVLASRRFKPGEVILVEKPFAKFLVPDEMWNHCSHCLRHCLNGIPCKKCPFALFCSEKCQQESFEDHKIECQLLKYFDSFFIFPSKLQWHHILAVNAVTKTPAVNILNYTREKVVEEFDEERKVVLSGGRYEWNDYKTICDFVTHSSKITELNLKIMCFEVSYLLKVLETTTYFDQVTSEAMQQTKVAVFSLLLNHLQSFPLNLSWINEFTINLSSLRQSKHNNVGYSIYSTFSLFSHSCNGNVSCTNCREAMVMRTTDLIEKGEEIAFSYLPNYLKVPKMKRTREMMKYYKFECACEACVNNWPTYNLLPKYPRWICLQCRLPNRSIFEDKWQCYKCKEVVDGDERMMELLIKQENFKVFKKLVKQFKPSLALEGTVEYLEHLLINIQQPNSEIEKVKKTLDLIYSLTSNCCLMYA